MKPPEKLQLDAFRNAMKTLENEHKLHRCPDVPFYSLSAKIRCCHFRNNILSMWYEVFLTLLVLSVWIVWVGLFISGILRIAYCVFFCVCYLAATLWQTIGLSVNLSLPWVLRQALDGGVHQAAPRLLWEGLGGPLCQSPSIVL